MYLKIFEILYFILSQTHRCTESRLKVTILDLENLVGRLFVFCLPFTLCSVPRCEIAFLCQIVKVCIQSHVPMLRYLFEGSSSTSLNPLIPVGISVLQAISVTLADMKKGFGCKHKQTAAGCLESSLVGSQLKTDS